MTYWPNTTTWLNLIEKPKIKHLKELLRKIFHYYYCCCCFLPNQIYLMFSLKRLLVVPIIVFLYYASYSKDYIYLNLSTSGIYISGHVVYDENSFSIFDWLAFSSFLYLYHVLLRGILFFFFIHVHYYPLCLKSCSIYNITTCSPSSSSPDPIAPRFTLP